MIARNLIRITCRPANLFRPILPPPKSCPPARAKVDAHANIFTPARSSAHADLLADLAVQEWPLSTLSLSVTRARSVPALLTITVTSLMDSGAVFLSIPNLHAVSSFFTRFIPAHTPSSPPNISRAVRQALSPPPPRRPQRSASSPARPPPDPPQPPPPQHTIAWLERPHSPSRSPRCLGASQEALMRRPSRRRSRLPPLTWPTTKATAPARFRRSMGCSPRSRLWL